MEVTVTIAADEDELSEVIPVLSSLSESASAEVDTGGELNSVESAIGSLSEEERYVLWALQESPGSALRVIHRTATQAEDSPFNDFDSDNGWNDERQRVRNILWELRGELTRNDGQLWYPTEDAPRVDLP